jgi:DNA-binding beta-propeller fold protein YncE
MAWPGSASAQLNPGDIVVADRDADAVFKVDPNTGAVSVLAMGPPLLSPVGVTIDRDGNVLVVDQDAPVFEGGVFKLIPGSAPSVFATSPLFSDPIGIAVDSAGRIVVSDTGADPAGLGGNTGAVFRFAPGTAPAPLATSPLFVGPQYLAVDVHDQVTLADFDAVTGPGNGTVFRITPAGAVSVFANSSSFVNPFGVAIAPDAQVLVADDSVIVPPNAGSGTIFRVPPGGSLQGAPAALPGSPDFQRPEGVALDAEGRLVIADPEADPAPMVGDGAIFRSVPGTVPAVLARSALFQQPQGVAVVPPKCFGRFATIVGDPNANTLIGTPNRDVIVGMGGKDVLSGLQGNDLMCGGAGDDLLKGKNGADKLAGEAGRDTLRGGKGKDRLVGGKGKDRLSGGKGKDKLKGGPGKDKENQ